MSKPRVDSPGRSAGAVDSPGRSGVPVDSPNGLILIGGRSVRMGQDKSQLTYYGKPQRNHLAALLEPYCQRVYWSVNARQATELLASGQLLIMDAFDWRGPLNGILSAFRHDPAAAWLVVACDLPLLTTRSLDALINGRDPAKKATAFRGTDGLPDPLLSIWEPAFVPIIDLAVTTGQYSPRQLLQQHDIQLLTAPAIEELTNINDPAARTRLGF